MGSFNLLHVVVGTFQNPTENWSDMNVLIIFSLSKTW